MKDLDGALELARQMVAIGTAHGRKVAALITDMDKPLGHNIGNALEVAESMAVLQGKGPADLTEVCLQLAANHGLESVAFCCISTGEFHFPNELAAEIAVHTIKEFLVQDTSVRKVIFNVFKNLDYEIYRRLLGAG